MAGNPGKSAFEAFVPEEGGPVGRDVIGTSGTQPSDEHAHAVEALRCPGSECVSSDHR
jgi:hypothetical protein